MELKIKRKDIFYSVLIDDEDYVFIEKYNLNISKNGYVTAAEYCRNSKKNKLKYLHRIIFKSKPGDIVDHINRNKLDNRKINLWKSDKSRNAINSKIRTDNTSGAKGVYLHKPSGKFYAILKYNKKYRYLGFFKDKDSAIKARLEAFKKEVSFHVK